MAPTTASASAQAHTAAVVAREGVQIASRGGAGGYTRITASATLFTEVGETLPGQVYYDTALPFYRFVNAPASEGVGLGSAHDAQVVL